MLYDLFLFLSVPCIAVGIKLGRSFMDNEQMDARLFVIIFKLVSWGFVILLFLCSIGTVRQFDHL